MDYEKQKQDYLILCKNIAVERNGQCLSETYVNARIPIKWFCNVCKKEWTNSLDNIKNKEQWCPFCAAKTRNEKNKLGIKICKDYAISKGRIMSI